MKYKVTNKIEMLNEEFDLEEYNMTNDDYVNDYIDAESEEEAIRTAMDYLSEQIQNNGFEVEFNKEEKEMTVYKDDEPLEKWNNFRAEEQVRDIDIENVDIFFVQNDEFVKCIIILTQQPAVKLFIIQSHMNLFIKLPNRQQIRKVW